MQDTKYCYPNSDVLKNKLNITDQQVLFEAETRLTAIRLRELEKNPIKGKYNFEHLKNIHKYIFQDIYDWAGKERTVEIGKGNLFCTTACLQDYAKSIFDKYYSQCYANKDNLNDYIRVFAINYGDLNALHPFREGNGRTQREFAREVCLACGYDFNLSCVKHENMLEASILSFNKGDNSGFFDIFSKAVTPHTSELKKDLNDISILTSDDLTIGFSKSYDYYEYTEYENAEIYNSMYMAKISKMDADKVISEAQLSLASGKNKILHQQKK